MQFDCIAFNVRMSEVGGLVSLEVTELFQESRNLDDYPENVLVRGMVVHRKALNSLVVLNHRVKPFFLQLLPILAQLVLIVVVKHEQKVLDVRNCFLQLKVTLSGE
jgi:hypothetical protein